ncbi:metallophosphoesterase, partial [Leucobacter soli]
GVQLRDSELRAPDAELGAGLVAEAAGHAAIHDNDIEVEITAHGLAAGVAGRVLDQAVVKHNLIRQALQAATTAAVVGEESGDDTEVIGNVVVGDDSDGLDEHLKSTYAGLRWDFIDAWMWDLVTQLPRVKYVAPEEMPNRITATFHGDPGTRRAFTWYQDIAMVEPGAILSTDPSFPEDATLTVEAEASTSNEGEAFYRVVVTGLTPGLTYYYRVGDTFTGKWSDTGTFETADGEDDFSFITITDTQARGGASEAVVSANTIAEALRTAPDAEFIVHGGDVVQTSEEENDWIELFGYAQESLLATTIAPVSGNHDAGTDEFTQHFALRAVNGQDTTTGVYYSYDYNDAHFVMLNTNEGRDGHNATDMSDQDYEPISDAQLAWIEEDVEQARARGAKWIILTTHKGPYTAGAHAADPDILSLRDRLVPLIDELDVDLVLQGHDHYWTRTEELASDPDSPVRAKRLKSDVITEVIGGIKIDYKVDQRGTVFVTPGTAGSKHYGQMQGIAEGDAPFGNEEYLDLFDRLGGGVRFSSNSYESFLEVLVTDGRLTVNRHEVGSNDKASFAEGFGIDRGITPVDEQLAALPKAAGIKLTDEPAVAAARAAVRTLT